MLDIAAALFDFPENVEKLIYPSSSLARENDHYSTHKNKDSTSFSLPVDILDTPKEYIFYLDVPGLSKSDIQVAVEEEKTLVIRSNGKRKREEEGCKYVRLERRAPHKIMRKFVLPENSNVEAISAKCENGVLTVKVEKLPPLPMPKTVQIAIA